VSAAGEEKALFVGFDSAYPPFSYLDDRGYPAGFVVDIMTELAQVMNLQIEFRADEWAIVRSELESGEIDVLAGMYFSQDRDGLVDFSQPIINVSFAAFAATAPELERLEDLNGKKVIVQREDILHDFLRSQEITPELTLVESPRTALALLAAGEHEYSLLSRLQGLYLVHELGLDTIAPASASILDRNYCLAVPEGKSALLSQLNEGLAILHSTRQFERIYTRWFGQDRPHVNVFRTVLLVAGPIFLLLLFTSFLLWVLRSKVRERTRELQDELSERKRAEALLQESERRYRLLVENAIDIIYECDLNGRFIFANAMATRAAAFARDEIIGKYYLEFVAPPFQQELFNRHRQQLEERIPSVYEEFLAQRKDGSMFWVAQNVQLVMDNGRPVAYQAVARDIDKQRKAEEAVRRSEARYRTLFARVPVAIWELDYSPIAHWTPQNFEKAARYLVTLLDEESQAAANINRYVILKDANEAAVNLFKARDKDHLLEAFPAIFHRDAYATLARELPRIWAGGHLLEMELPATAFDGTPLELTVRQYVPQLGGKSDLANVVTAITDITERKATELTLQRYATQLRLFHAIDQGVLQAQSVASVAEAALAGAAPLIPYDRASLVLFDRKAKQVELIAIRTHGTFSNTGRRIWSFAEYGLDEQLLAGERKTRRLQSDAHTSVVERALSHQGLRFAMNVPLMIDHEVVGALNFASAKEECFTEEEIRTAEETAAIVATALRHLRLYEQTRRDAETMLVLLQEVNHRVKNNLAAIIGMLYVEQRHLDPEEQKIYKPFLEELIRRVRGLSAVHELLSETQWQPLPLSRLCNQVIHATLYGLSPDKEISIRINPSPLFVTSDVAHHLALVLNELTTNTIKHAMLARKHAAITVMAYSENGLLYIIYRDDGPGFPVSMLEDRALYFHVGYGLIQNITEKILGGKLVLSNDNGAQTSVIIQAQREEVLDAIAQ
jgi:PAS domain S-box-containing protein